MDELEIRKKRALYRSVHRGTKELDLLLGRYAMARVEAMTADELAVYEQFLVLPDPHIDSYLRGAPAPCGIAAIVADVRAFLGMK